MSAAKALKLQAQCAAANQAAGGTNQLAKKISVANKVAEIAAANKVAEAANQMMAVEIGEMMVLEAAYQLAAEEIAAANKVAEIAAANKVAEVVAEEFGEMMEGSDGELDESFLDAMAAELAAEMGLDGQLPEDPLDIL